MVFGSSGWTLFLLTTSLGALLVLADTTFVEQPPSLGDEDDTVVIERKISKRCIVIPMSECQRRDYIPRFCAISKRADSFTWAHLHAIRHCIPSNIQLRLGDVSRSSANFCSFLFLSILPDLGALDGWVLGVYDTCSYVREDGRMSFGICCSNYILNSTPTPVIDTDDPSTSGPIIEDVEPPEEDKGSKKPKPPVASWPPPIPTHPPDHTIPPLPTHPPHPGLPTQATLKPTTQRPSTLRPVATTWPTKRPAGWPSITSSTSVRPTIKPTFPPMSSSSCGAKNGDQDQERIVGGQSADPGEWPWIAALFNAGRHFCGGSLIDDNHILTAAHCVAHMNSWDVARLTVRLGDHNIKVPNEVRHVERRVKRVVRHRGFDSRTLYNDVAILTLSDPVEFTEQIRPICLPSGSQLYSGKYATVIGWGSLRESGPQPSVLQEVVIPVWSNTECKSKYGAAAPGGIVDSFLCAGRAAKDSCSGDSGGPLMVNDGRWTQVGIVSWGIGCGKGRYPGVYTRVTHFLPWINKNLKQ